MNQGAGANDRVGRAFRTLLGVAVLVIFFVGVLAVARVVWTLLRRLNYGFISPTVNWFHDYVWLHPDGWITALATALLAWATIALTRSTQAQVAGDAPLIRYGLFMDEPNIAETKAYLEEYRLRDLSAPALAPFIAGEPRYVRISIDNEQSKVYGVALDVKLIVRLSWGANDNVSSHPYYLDSTVFSPAIGAGKTASGRIFNIGTLPNFSARVVELSYRTIANKSRRVGYGSGILWQKLDQPGPASIETVFKPRKRELMK